MSERNFAFASSGDPEEDERIAQRIELNNSRMEQNICPNGCGPMTFIDLHNRECPVCHFHGWQNTPIKMPNERIQ